MKMGFLIILLVMTFVCGVAALPVPRRRVISYGEKFLSQLNPRRRISQKPQGEKEEKTTHTIHHRPPQLVPNLKQPTEIISQTTPHPKYFVSVNSSADLDIDMNYDYDYLDYFYELDLLDSIDTTSATDTHPRDANNSLQDREATTFPYDPPLDEETNATQEVQSILVKPEVGISDKPVLPPSEISVLSVWPFRYTTSIPFVSHRLELTGKNSRTSFKEPYRITSSRTNKSLSTLEAKRELKNRNKVHLSSNHNDKDTLSERWSSKSSNYEINVEVPRARKIPSRDNSFSKFRNSWYMRSPTKNNLRLKETLVLEISTAPEIVDLRSNGMPLKDSSTGKDTFPTSTIQRTVLKANIGTDKQQTVDTKHTFPLESKDQIIQIIPSVNRDAVKSEGDSIIEVIQPTTHTPDIADTNTVTLLLTLPVSVLASRATAEFEAIDTYSSVTADPAVYSTTDSNIMTTLKPSDSPTTFAVTEHGTSISESTTKPSPLSLLSSQLGLNPMGANPIGRSPFGTAPGGISPFGLKPGGTLPQGSAPTVTNLHRFRYHESTVVQEETYHVQVKKPDGSINGDYVVLDHLTGNVNGVRYEAVDGADQALIQRALLSFLSLGPRLNSRSDKLE